MAVLSAALTASIAGVSATPWPPRRAPDPTLPDGTSVPTQAIEAPASVSDGSRLGLGVGDGEPQQIVATASTSGIPSAALSAYQRAETVINAADTGLPHLLAAGRRDRPRRVQPRPRQRQHPRRQRRRDARHLRRRPQRLQPTAEIVDTDAGQFDNDAAYDRAVGPMQFIPSTWSVVGVDADGDGVRNPQDIDDAALGTAVYLCSGSDDLGTDAGRRGAVYRYNHSQSYVDLVLAIMDAYLDGDFTSIPNGTVMAGALTQHAPAAARARHAEPAGRGAHHQAASTTRPTTPSTRRPPMVAAAPPTTTATTAAAPPAPATATGSGGVHVPGTHVSIPPLPTTSIPPVDEVLTLAQATVQCTLDGINQLLNPQAFQTCLNNYMNPSGP